MLFFFADPPFLFRVGGCFPASLSQSTEPSPPSPSGRVIPPFFPPLFLFFAVPIRPPAHSELAVPHPFFFFCPPHFARFTRFSNGQERRKRRVCTGKARTCSAPLPLFPPIPSTHPRCPPRYRDLFPSDKKLSPALRLHRPLLAPPFLLRFWPLVRLPHGNFLSFFLLRPFFSFFFTVSLFFPGEKGVQLFFPIVPFLVLFQPHESMVRFF